ncbi:putative deoxyribonuclease tatdn3 isoform X3 [Coregonus clupeaformis]|uniref:putative deoxyribonuclease tatdn3 isoform X3 n=1 Tax=Coregonus clupeaformis TaxID=59861 RepID=UPI001BDFA4A2|nr:putative deoxyribonuclease tatdn3 isoform X3 [Coregonus clupeaformis]
MASMDCGFVDCHCHITACEFAEDLEDVIKRTRESTSDVVPFQAGVKTLISVTEEASEFERVIQLFKGYPDLVAPCFGIHPVQGCGSQDQRSVKIQDLEPALPLFQKYRDDIVAVGEEREEQLTVFTKQLQISKDLDLPVNIHSRSAAKITIATLKEQGITCALLHNFAGKPSVAMEGVQAGYFFSFPPAVCRNEQKAKLIKQIPLEHICLETDSPALGPEKYVRNEPKNISLVCEYIAHVKGITPEMVIHATTDNALRLFTKIKRLE